jgi:hypothetical protein
MRRKTEDHHNSPEQIAAYVTAAVKLADECDLTNMDRAVLLPTILALVSNKQLFYEEIGNLPNMVVPRGMG